MAKRARKATQQAATGDFTDQLRQGEGFADAAVILGLVVLLIKPKFGSYDADHMVSLIAGIDSPSYACFVGAICGFF